MGSKKTTSTSRSDPYVPIDGYMKGAGKKLTDYLNDPRSTAVYDGKRTVDMSGVTRDGLDGLANNKGAASSRDYLQRTLDGEFLKADNPYVQQLQKSVQSSVMPSLNSTFAKSGMMGSTMHQGALSRGMTDGMANPLFQNYQNERRMQDGAASALPQLDDAVARNKIAAGQMGEGYDREKMQANWQKWQEEQDAPLRALQKTYGMASDMGSRYGTQTQTQKQYGNPWEQAAGLGMMGLSAVTGMPGLGMGGMGMMGGGQGFAGMMGGMSQYGMSPWMNAGGGNFNFRGGFGTPGQRA